MLERSAPENKRAKPEAEAKQEANKVFLLTKKLPLTSTPTPTFTFTLPALQNS